MLNYEKGFQNFDELIYTNEQLNSFLHASKEHCLEKLKDQYTVCQTISIINLKKKKHVFEIQNRNVFSTLHPLSKKHLFFQTECFSPKESLKNFESHFSEWNIDDSKIDYFNISKNQNNYALTISHISIWEDLELNHLRYYHFLLEIEKLYTTVIKSIRLTNLSNSNHEVLMDAYQKMKFEINLNIYDLLKEYNIDIKNCNLKIKDEYNRIDYIITILAYLEKIQESIEKRYENCIEKVFNVSSNWMQTNLIELQEKITFIENSLYFSNIPKELKYIVLNLLGEFKNKSLNDEIQFKKFNYITVFTNHLENLLRSFVNSNQLTENRFLEFLIEMNFNEFNFLEWLTKDIKSKAYKIQNVNAKVEYYMNLNIKFLNFPIRISSMFVESNVDLKTQLLNLIASELKYMNFEVVDKVNKPKTSKSKLKLKNNLSSITLLLNVMNDTKFIEEMTTSEIAKFICENFSTAKQENLSFDSIRNKLYEEDPKAINDLVFALKNMVMVLNKKLI